MSSSAALNSSITTETRSQALWRQTLPVAVFGCAVLFAVGFLPMDIAHNAAHDVRHALAFPCH